MAFVPRRLTTSHTGQFAPSSEFGGRACARTGLHLHLLACRPARERGLIMWVLPLGFAFGALLAQPWQEPCSQFASTDAAASTTKAAPSEPERLGHPQRGDSTQQKKPPDSEARQPTLAKELGNGYFQAFSSSQANSASLSASRGTMRTERSESNVSAASTHPSTTPIFSSTERASDAVPKIPLDGRPGQRMAPNKSPRCVSFCPAAGTETKLRSDDFRFDTSSAPPTRSLPTVPQRPVGRSPPAPPQDRPMAPSRSPPAPPQDSHMCECTRECSGY